MKPFYLFLNVYLFIQMNQIKDTVIEHTMMQQGCVEIFIALHAVK